MTDVDSSGQATTNAELRVQPARDRAIEATGWLRSMVSTSSRDWGQSSGDALVYGVLVGWDCPPGVCDEAVEDAEHWCERATADLATRHGWTAATVEKMRERNAALRALAGEAGAPDTPPADEAGADLVARVEAALDTADLDVIHRENGVSKGATALARWLVTNGLVPDAGRDRDPVPAYPQEWCDDMTGPNGAGGPCVLGPGHHHRDGIGGEWGASVVPAAAPAEQVEEWAAWEDTHTDDPNDEVARARPLTDRADAEDYVLMPKARRRRIARRTVTRSRWLAVDAAPETTEET